MPAQSALLNPARSALTGVIEAHGVQAALCYQCKKCTSGCPVAEMMDYRPHQMMRLAQLGAADRLLASNAIWTCVGCYTCTTRCPQGLSVADLVHALKNVALHEAAGSKKSPVPAFYRSFVKTVGQYGRNSEISQIVRFYFATGIGGAIKERAMGTKLLLQGRLPLMPHKVHDQRALKTLLNRNREEAKP